MYVIWTKTFGLRKVDKVDWAGLPMGTYVRDRLGIWRVREPALTRYRRNVMETWSEVAPADLPGPAKALCLVMGVKL